IYRPRVAGVTVIAVPVPVEEGDDLGGEVAAGVALGPQRIGAARVDGADHVAEVLVCRRAVDGGTGAVVDAGKNDPGDRLDVVGDFHCAVRQREDVGVGHRQVDRHLDQPVASAVVALDADEGLLGTDGQAACVGGDGHLGADAGPVAAGGGGEPQPAHRRRAGAATGR